MEMEVSAGWVCPRCRHENRTVWVPCLAAFEVRLKDGELSLGGAPVRFDEEDYDADPNVYCPNCGEPVTFDEFKGSVEDWLKRHPKKHAEVLAVRFQST
jgi:rubredoxin